MAFDEQAYQREYRQKNRKLLAAKSRAYHARKPWVRRDYQLKRKYGVSLDVYKKMSEDQGHVCCICRKPEPVGKRLAVDHDHQTGKVRSLLCSRCNLGVGQFDDNPDRLRSAAAYLEEHKCPAS